MKKIIATRIKALLGDGAEIFEGSSICRTLFISNRDSSIEVAVYRNGASLSCSRYTRQWFHDPEKLIESIKYKS
jgi:hypothetical protein